MAKMFRGVARGDARGKMEQVWGKYGALMLFVARKYLDEAGAEDAVSESCIKIFRNIDKIDDVFSYQSRAYIVSIVRNTAIDFVRKAARAREDNDVVLDFMADDSGDILDRLISREGYEGLKQAIEDLPDQLRDAIYLSLVHNYSHGEIAKMLGISQAASKMRLMRAKKEIRKRLG